MDKKHLTYDLISKYRSALMGMAILSIIIFHFVQDCHSADVRMFGLYKLYYDKIGASAVDIFLLLSGFGLFYSFKNKTTVNLKQFYKTRFIKILVPYFIIAIPAWVWRTLLLNKGTFLDYIFDLSFISFFTKGTTWFWFIFAIGILYLAFPFFYQVIDEEESDLSSLFRVLAFFCITAVINICLFVCSKDLFDRFNIFSLRVFPFIFGIYIGRLACKKKKISKDVIALCCCSVIPVLYNSFNSLLVTRFISAYFHIAVFFGLIILFEYFPFRKIKNVVIKILEWVGQYTLELYLTHIVFRRVFISSNLYTYRIRYELLMVLLSFICAVLLKWLSQLLIKVFSNRSGSKEIVNICRSSAADVKHGSSPQVNNKVYNKNMFRKFSSDTRKYIKYSISAAKAQLKSEVANSYLNWIWWVLEPLCFTIIYYVVFGLFFNMKEDYLVPFLIIGVALWDFFNNMMKNCVGIMRANKSIVSRVYLPKYILIFVRIGVNGFKMMITFTMVIIAMIIFSVPFSFKVFYAIPIFIILFLFCFGISCFLLHLGVFVADMKNIVNIVLRMLFYLTGIFYNVTRRIPAPAGHIIGNVNPVAYCIITMRNVMLYDTSPDFLWMAVWFAVSALLCILGIRLVYRNENSYVKSI